ncbi:MAG: carboxynorspermidine decarboxylase, partial [Oscillospiraceae bacterium]|nr:carboxynorspermidine decarboxylase [Oscillospiraceae bacterium]
LSGTEASGLFEAKLGAEEMPDKEVHVFCAAYRDDEFDELLKYADHIVFNSPNQLKKFGEKAKSAGKSIGLRINPECSTQEGHEIYDPCAVGSRLGTTRSVWDKEMTEKEISLLDGLHFHTLCEQDSDALEITLKAVEQKFGDVLPRMKWLNMGGGHHITRADYDIPRLERLITYAQNKWPLTVYLEPGEAVALNAGFLASRVLDIVENGGIKTAVIDASAACHMPDVIEMPYTPPLYSADENGEKPHKFRLAGPTCLAGDVVGDYSFDEEIHIGDLLLFGDMAIYSTCKNNTFNGMPLPDIYKLGADSEIEKLTDFGYSDFKMRLGSR